jgi:hypothetical protein
VPVDGRKGERRKFMFHRKRTTLVLTIITLLALGLAWGCGSKGEEVPLEEPKVEQEEAEMPALPTKIMVPEDIIAAWKAVVLEVTDKETSERTDYTFNIGETAPVGATGLTLTVEAFLPSFQMAGDVFTSSSPDLNNPAVKVKIKDENGTLIHDRWLFSLYPATHPFEHPKYAIILKDYVASE